jgi:hypothetical protein
VSLYQRHTSYLAFSYNAYIFKDIPRLDILACLSQFIRDWTERRDRVVNAQASYLGGLRLESWPPAILSFFMVSVSPSRKMPE